MITLDFIKSEHEKVAALIAEFEANAPRTFVVPASSIDLHKGEHYAGIALDEDGKPSHHLVLMADTTDRLTWDAAKTWAASVGGELPTRREQSLLYANLKQHFESAWYWSGEQHASYSDSAWHQYFGTGSQYNYHEDNTGCCRAVRRLPI